MRGKRLRYRTVLRGGPEPLPACHNRRRDVRRGPARNESRPTPMLLCGYDPFN
jgi:hypothetical protein